jgi:hypothetical protein
MRKMHRSFQGAHNHDNVNKTPKYCTMNRKTLEFTM